MATNKKSRIIIVNRFFGGTQTPTGRMAYDVAIAIKDAGHDVTVLTSRAQYTCRKEQPEIASLKVSFLWSRENAGRLETWLLFWLQTMLVLPFLGWNKCLIMTDPPFLAFAGTFAKLIHPRRQLFWWTMDLYPEALIAADVRIPAKKIILDLMAGLTSFAIARMDGIICLGEQQKKRLEKYPSWPAGRSGFCVTIPPWDLRDLKFNEQNVLSFRREFNWHEKKVAVYAGNLGEAHTFKPILNLAQHLLKIGDTSWIFAFFCRGSKANELKRLSADLPNIEVNDYLAPARTADLMQSADVHIITLAKEWNGIVVPSKLYGVLETRAPVIFFGPVDSDTAREITRLNLGITIDSDADVEWIAGQFGSVNLRHQVADGSNRPNRVAEFILKHQPTD